MKLFRRSRQEAVLLTQTEYGVRARRSLATRVLIQLAMLLTTAGIVFVTSDAWRERDAASHASCAQAAAPTDPDLVAAELARTRLSLVEERAARAEVQKSADAAAADVARLTQQLRFLRGFDSPLVGDAAR